MNEDEVRTTLLKLREERAAIEPALRDLRAKEGALNLSIDGFEALLRAMTGDGSPPAPTPSADATSAPVPRGADAVRRVLLDE
ncbi:MAG TPA: hypothetical protein VHK88_13655, partial [Aquihabitans sp.]|nr:hypothetical protein [Aquihabitans sp.]